QGDNTVSIGGWGNVPPKPYKPTICLRILLALENEDPTLNKYGCSAPFSEKIHTWFLPHRAFSFYGCGGNNRNPFLRRGKKQQNLLYAFERQCNEGKSKTESPCSRLCPERKGYGTDSWLSPVEIKPSSEVQL
ncbi:hypothetical protein, partial [Vacuolonema iberomarrocanum]|uniref:hypothetical protein n=1 Tax=Vacuolonema iberomarrocanum TaxID=3454632 RepID=UPI003F6E3944